MNSQSPTTSHWATYIESTQRYSFKYPATQPMYRLAPIPASSTRSGVYLERDAKYITGGGFAGGDVLESGVVISFIFYQNRQFTETEVDLRHEFGTDLDFKSILVHDTYGEEIVFPPNIFPGRRILFARAHGVLEITAYIGFATDRGCYESYLSGFERILSTLRFSSEK